MIKEKVPDAVLAVLISHLILSLEPLSRAPLDNNEEVLLNNIPLSKVSRVKATEGDAKSSRSISIIATDEPVPKADAAIVNSSPTRYPEPADVTVILVIVLPEHTTVTCAPVPVPPVKFTAV